MKLPNHTDKPKVAVVTRTLRRDWFLRRAADSLINQTFKEFTWVLVNDGGDPAPVENIAEYARQKGIPVLVKHNKPTRGMEAASNIGIRLLDSEYIAVHDDDDAWMPEFLQRTVSFLESRPAYSAVITHTLEVTEEIRNNKSYVLGKKARNANLHYIFLPDLFRCNLFPPISMLFRRSAYNAIGPFDESLPVLGDWEFNMRLILHGDIAVIPEPLARYYVRQTADPDSGNSTISRRGTHLEYEMIIRNRIVRGGLQSGHIHPAMLPAFDRLLTLRSQPPAKNRKRGKSGILRSMVRKLGNI